MSRKLKSAHRALQLESLEERRCFAANFLSPNPGYINTAPKPTMTVYQGELRIAGTSYNDTVTVAQYDPYNIKITAANQFGSTSAIYGNNYFARVRFDAGNGADTFNNHTFLPSTVFGGEGVDTIYGGNSADILNGEGGDDTIDGRGGNDIINGGLNSDTIFGGNGQDAIYGDWGVDYLHGGGDRDFIYGQMDGDYLWGDGGDDHLEGGDGDDEIWGGLGDDTLHGRRGNDTLWGEEDNDTLDGEEDFDQLHGGSGNDHLAGGQDGIYDYLWGEGGSDTFVRYVTPSWYYDDNSELYVTYNEVVEQDGELDLDEDDVIDEVVV